MKVKGVFLTGAKGFLGIHILKALLDETDSDIYCLVRGVNTVYEDFEIRFNRFFGSFDSYKDRVKLLMGDFSEDNFALNERKLNEIKYKTNVVIHAGAYVKHFGKKEDFQKNNCQGTKNIAAFAYENRKFMVYISSMAVSGKYADEEGDLFDERVLGEGEFHSDNLYIKSKVTAENIFTGYICKGLKGQLIRVGALTGRKSDGVFQINQWDNAFYARLKTIIRSGLLPVSLLDYKIEFTPIDQCAYAIIKLLITPKENFSVFHLFNDNYLTFSELMDLLNTMGYDIKSYDFNSFSEYKEEAKKYVDTQTIKVGFCLFLRNHNHRNGKLQKIISCRKTKEYLSLLGFQWLKIDTIYLKKIIRRME